MKKLYTLCIVLLVFVAGCSNDSDGSVNNGSDGAGGSTAIFALVGNYLYSVDHGDLNVFSLLNASGPVKVNDVNVGFDIETLFSRGNNLYMGSRNGMFMYSIENPENPKLISSVTHFTSCDPVVATATHAFVTLHSNTWCGNNTNMLLIYDMANPKEPELIHSRNLVSPKGLGLYNNYLIICDDEIKIFDISNPLEPVLKASIAQSCNDVIILGNDLYAVGDRAVYNYALNSTNIKDITLKSELSF